MNGEIDSSRARTHVRDLNNNNNCCSSSCSSNKTTTTTTTTNTPFTESTLIDKESESVEPEQPNLLPLGVFAQPGTVDYEKWRLWQIMTDEQHIADNTVIRNKFMAFFDDPFHLGEFQALGHFQTIEDAIEKFAEANSNVDAPKDFRYFRGVLDNMAKEKRTGVVRKPDDDADSAPSKYAAMSDEELEKAKQAMINRMWGKAEA